MGRRHLTKDEINERKKIQAEALSAAGKSIQLVTLVVLHDQLGYDADQLNEFLDLFQQALEYYNDESHDYNALLHEWNDYFVDYIGVDILSKDNAKRSTRGINAV